MRGEVRVVVMVGYSEGLREWSDNSLQLIFRKVTTTTMEEVLFSDQECKAGRMTIRCK